jgi:proteasome accessory factor C
VSSPSATQRLSRLLAMVPWLLRRQGVPLAEAARHFGITQEQLVKDLELLFVCGTPGTCRTT